MTLAGSARPSLLGGFDAAFGVEAGDARRLLATREVHQHFHLARHGIGGRIHARDGAVEDPGPRSHARGTITFRPGCTAPMLLAET